METLLPLEDAMKMQLKIERYQYLDPSSAPPVTEKRSSCTRVVCVYGSVVGVPRCLTECVR